MSNNFKIAIGSFLGGFILGLIIVLALPNKQPQQTTTEVERYIINESEGKVDSLIKLSIASKKTIDSLKNIKHEKSTNYKPLERTVITDSSKSKNVLRFLKQGV